MASATDRDTAYLAAHQSVVLLIGRLAIAYIFLPSGIHKLMGLEHFAASLSADGLPYAYPVAVLAALVEAGGALFIVLGWLTRPVAILMAAFTMVAAFTAHRYWQADADHAMMQTIQFNKNIAIAGGYLILAVAGAGAWSLDGRRG
jgi:putative oxidoreductase